MIDQIDKVLSDWNYDEALRIFKASTKDQALVNILSSGETVFFRSKLKDQLKSLKSQILANQEKQSLIPTTSNIDKTQLTPIIERRNEAIRWQDFLRGQLQLLKDSPQEEVYPVCLEIIELDDILNECWKAIHYFEQHGQLPPDEVDQILQTCKTWMDLTKIHSNYKANVSKAKSGKLPEGKLKFYQEVLSRAESQLNTPLPC